MNERKVAFAATYSPQAGCVFFAKNYTLDANGNVSAVVSATDSTAFTYYEYGPFGQVLAAEGAMAEANPFRFSSKYWDDETELVYYGYRYYSPQLGRWIRRDPIGEWGGVGLYTAMRNRPVSVIDRLGLFGQNDPPDTVECTFCGDTVFNDDTKCCCLNGTVMSDGTLDGAAELISKAAVFSGVEKWKWTADEASAAGYAYHWWITWPGGSADANYGDTGNYYYPAFAVTAGLVASLRQQNDLSPCDYDFQKLWDCLSDKAEKYFNGELGTSPSELCDAYVGNLLGACLSESAGCTSQSVLDSVPAPGSL